MPRRSSPPTASKPSRPLKGLTVIFADLRDPREPAKTRYPLIDLLFIALAAVLCGATGYEDVATFAEGASDWLAQFIDVSRGTPGHDVFRRTFDRLNPTTFADCFARWTQSLSASLRGEVVAVDGKSVRGAFDRARRTTPLHLLHVWATRQRLLLHVQAVEGAPGEVAAIPEALRLLELSGAIVTADANGLTKEVTEAAREAGAHYALALKGNRGALRKQVEAAYEAAAAKYFVGEPATTDTTADEGHGRIERRTATAVPLSLARVPAAEGYRDARSVLCIERARITPGKPVERERHFYLASLAPKAKGLNEVVRRHWGVENHLHRGLDVIFREDASTIRKGIGATIFAVIRRVADTLVRRDTQQAKRSMAQRRKLAGWNYAYLTHLLTLATP